MDQRDNEISSGKKTIRNIFSRAIFVGIENAVQEMKRLMVEARVV